MVNGDQRSMAGARYCAMTLEYLEASSLDDVSSWSRYTRQMLQNGRDGSIRVGGWTQQIHEVQKPQRLVKHTVTMTSHHCLILLFSMARSTAGDEESLTSKSAAAGESVVERNTRLTANKRPISSSHGDLELTHAIAKW